MAEAQFNSDPRSRDLSPQELEAGIQELVQRVMARPR